MTRPELPPELRQFYERGQLIVFAGAGVSAAGGLPGWRDLAESLREEVARDPATTPETLDEIDDLIKKNQLINAFTAIEQAIRAPRFGEAIRRRLDDHSREEPPEIAKAIAALKPRLRAVLTTNLDRFLERAFTGSWDPLTDPPPDTAQGGHYIFKLHGTLRDRSTWVFTRRQYEPVMFASQAHQQAFDTLYRAYSILFVGYGLDDLDLELTLGVIRARANDQPPKHFAILPRGLGPSRKRMLDDAGVHLIEYDNADGRHAEALRILRELAGPPAPPPPLAVTSSAGAAAVGAGAAPAVRPRVLVAGPYFGLSQDAAKRVREIWAEGLTPERCNRIEDVLRRPDVEQAQIGAIVRHDLIVDLSPWRAFARWKSDGLRELDAYQRDDSGAVLVHFAFPPEPLPGKPDDTLYSERHPLRGIWPLVHGQLGDSLACGVALGGLAGVPQGWWDALLVGCPPIALVTDCEPPTVEGRSFRRVERHDGTGADLTEREYLRALRVVAGQVTLAGEAGTRALQDVWMEVEITPRGQLEAERSASRRESRGDDDAREPSADDLAAELRARQEAIARMSAGSILSAEGVLKLAKRVLIWGEAGTGKTTLLRWLACKTAQRRMSSDSERLPVWIPRPAVRSREDLPDQLVKLAHEALHLRLDWTSPLAQTLRVQLGTGNAHLFLDSLEEEDAARNVLGRLHTDLNLHLASRPTQPLRGSYTEVELKGLTPLGIDRFLKGYFGDTGWIAGLLKALRELPDGARWTRTPVLLSMAASLYRMKGQLPDSVLDLYGEVLGLRERSSEEGKSENQLPERPLDRVVRDSGGEPRERIVAELSQLARGMLTHEAGRMTASLREEILPFELRTSLRRSGLFTGTEPLKFTHLTFGEYFAARAGLDLAAARARWRATQDLSHEEGLEVLPMAHALQGEPALTAALEDAEARDAPDHRMLRLLLRALRYGGSGVRAFCEARAAKVLELVLARLQMPSGRFGDAERRLLDAAEPALLVLAPFLRAGVGGTAGHKALLEPLLEMHGEVGTEAHVIAWTLGLRAPSRRWSGWWTTINRVARALVRHGLGVREIVKLTQGSEPHERDDVVRVLARFDACRPLLYYHIRNDGEFVREKALRALGDDPRARPLIRESLWDDEGRVRMVAIHESKPDHAAFDMLESCLEDRHSFPRSAAIGVLGGHPARWSALRCMLDHRSLDAQKDAIRALAQDPEARPRIIERLAWAIESRRGWPLLIDAAVAALCTTREADEFIAHALASDQPHFRTETLRQLAKDSQWYDAVLARAKTGDPSAIEALSDTPSEEHRSLFRKLLQHESRHVRSACIEALASDEASWHLLVGHLEEEGTQSSAINALKNSPSHRPALRDLFEKLRSDQRRDKDEIEDAWTCAHIVRALAHDHESRPLIIRALKDRSSEVRKAAIEVLAEITEEKTRIRPCLLDDSWQVQAAALAALADDDPGVRERLRSLLEFDDWALRISAFHLLVQQDAHRHHLQALLQSHPRERIAAFQPLARDPASRPALYALFQDASPHEQHTLLRVLRGDPELKDIARKMLNREFILGAIFWSQLVQGYLDFIGQDEESRHLLHQLFHDPMDVVAAAVAPAMVGDPDSKPRLLELLRSEDANARAAALAAVTPDADLIPAARKILATDEVNMVRAAAIWALADDLDSRDTLRSLLNDHDDGVRTAVFRALAQHVDEQERLWDRLRQEEKDELRAEIAKFLATQPAAAMGARPLMRACLADPYSPVRLAATKALSPISAPPGQPLADVPSLRLALHLAGAPMERLSNADYALQTRLLEFVSQPSPFVLEDDPGFAEALLGWLCVRLTWASPDGQLGRGRIFGEVKEKPSSLLIQTPLIIRVAMDMSQLPTERWLHPTHNLIEAWQVAKQLRSSISPTILLACADVDFADLVPPELAPGNASWGPTYFGFRLALPR